MSRVGKKPIPLLKEVEVRLEGGILTVKGPKGSLEFKPHKNLKVGIEDAQISVQRSTEEKLDRSLHGVTRSVIKNMIEGVTKGFSKELEIVGVGFRGQISGKKLILNLGFSHPIEYNIPEGVDIEMLKMTQMVENMPTQRVSIKGIDKAKVGEVASEIRSFYPPEPYKGKGIRYHDEVVRRKAGKAVVATT